MNFLNRFSKTGLYRTIQVALLAITLVVSWFLLLHDTGLNLGDEGYLWHNAQRTLEGSVPIRDFRSYDPGRYYWSALWFAWLGPGLSSLRISLAAFQFLGLFSGLLAIQRVIRNWWGLILSGMVIMLWMYPRHKIFEISLAMIAVLAATLLIEKPTARMHLIAGILVGLSAFFARNFGVYFGISFLVILFYLENIPTWRQKIINCGIWIIGILIGYSPMIFMSLFISGFFANFLDSVLRLFGPYTKFQPLPVPWPWDIAISDMLQQAHLQVRFILGLSYFWLYGFYFVGFLIVWRYKHRCMPLFNAAILVGIPLLHHASGRADFSHFAQSIYPALAGLLTGYPLTENLSREKIWRWLSIAILSILFWLLVQSSNEIYWGVEKTKIILNKPSDLVTYPLMEGNTVWLPQNQAEYISGLEECLAVDMTTEINIFIAPYEPGLYPIWQTASPIWDAFPLHKASIEEEKMEIEQLTANQVQWALISDTPLDGIPERRFSVSHHLIWQHLHEKFKPVSCPTLTEQQWLFHANP